MPDGPESPPPLADPALLTAEEQRLCLALALWNERDPSSRAAGSRSESSRRIASIPPW